MMNKSSTTTSDLLKKIEELENKLFEAEETIEAIKYDKIDALVISTKEGEKIYTLTGADKPYRIFLEQMNEGAVTLSNLGVILYSNKSFADMVQSPLEQLPGSELYSWVHPEDKESLVSFLNRADENHKQEIRFIRADGSVIYIYLSLKTVTLDNNETSLFVVATDLTEKKRSDEIVAAERLARSILEQAGEAIIVCDKDSRIIRASKAAEVLAGESVLYNHFDVVFPLFDENKNHLPIGHIIKNLNGSQIETTLIKKGNIKHNLILNIGTLSDSQNQRIGYVINLANITRHIEAEEKLSQSLKEKTVLLKEIHHRVKNNLQIISSLLRLQSLYVPEEHLLGILNECQNRINSMALIHQKLYESKSFASININEYLKELVMFLCSTYMISPDNIKLLMPEEEVSFTIDTAVPLGLIINELITNSFKHAFTTKGIVTITIKTDKDNVVISINDNGKGFPEDIDFFNPTTLGLQLVHSLVDQISATIQLKTDKGTEIIISTPKSDLQS